MTTACVPLVMAVLAAQGPILGQVTDARGKPVGGAEVVLTLGPSREGVVPVVAGTRANDAGRFTFKAVEFARYPDIGRCGTLWACKPDAALSLGIDDLFRNDRPDQVHRIVLEVAKPRKLTLRDDAGRPLAGVRVAPRLLQTEQTRYYGVAIPDAWLDRFTAMTDLNGLALVPGMSCPMNMRSASITLPGQGRLVKALVYAEIGQDATLTVGGPGRLSGRVEVSSPQATTLAEAAIDVWVRCESALGKDLTQWLAPEPVRTEPGAVRVAEDGRFETPRVLPRNATYRVVVRQPGFAPAISSWVRLAGDEATIPPVVLRPLKTIKGRVIDREGQPVAGVRVVQSGGGPATETDPAGRFALADAQSGPEFLISSKPGFRVQGLAVSEEIAGAAITIELRRTGEPPDRPMATLPPPIPLDESRKLARRVLHPALARALKQGNDAAKLRLLRAFRWIEPNELLEHVEKTPYTRTSTTDYLRGEAALGLAVADPEEAIAVAETIVDPSYKAGALVDLVDALPASELPRKLALLERAAAQARAAKLSSNKFFQMGEVAEHWFELGQKQKAEELFGEGRALLDALTPEKRTDAGSFLTHLARVDPTSSMSFLKNVGTDRWNQRMIANVASRLAFAFPTEAERAWEQLREPLWRKDAGLRICRRMARIDPERARRMAARFPDAAERAFAWTFLAEGLRETDPDGARGVLDRAIAELDSIPSRDEPDVWDPGPAASILPLVERIAPDRVAEVFWRAVARVPASDNPRCDLGRDQSPIDEVLLLSRYDRQAAATLFAPAADYVRSASLRAGGDDLTPATILTLAFLDPRHAVEVIESLPPARNGDISDPVNWARYELGELLAMPPDLRWLRTWRFHSGCGIAMFEEVYRGL
jgi:hypothetical protein